MIVKILRNLAGGLLVVAGVVLCIRAVDVGDFNLIFAIPGFFSLGWMLLEDDGE